MNLWPFRLNSEMPGVELSATQISQRLQRSYPGREAPPHPEFSFPEQLLSGKARPASVLIPLLRKNNEWHILFIRRTTKLAEHGGQVAFPGGRMDPQDKDPIQTALREAWEEIGLQARDVRILGQMQDFLTITNYRVTPIIGMIPWPYLLRPASEEVSRVFTIPLAWLSDPANREERLRNLPMPGLSIKVIYFKPYDGETLWGASASFTQAFLKILA